MSLLKVVAVGEYIISTAKEFRTSWYFNTNDRVVPDENGHI